MPHSRLARMSALAAALVLSSLTLTGVASAERPRYPVPYSLAGGFFADVGSLDHKNPPPGSNDWSCRPDAAHPEPVVLLHGLGGNQGLNWSTMSPLLANNGYCVFSLTYGTKWWLPTVGGLGSMRDSAATVSAFVDRVLAATGAAKAAIVGHSEGTTVGAFYLKRLGGAAKVDKLVGFSPNYEGTTLYGLTGLAQKLGPLTPLLDAVCAACREYHPGSDFIRDLNTGGTAAVPSVTYTNIQGPIEELVIPRSSGTLGTPNATNHQVGDGCPVDLSDHVSVVTSRRGGQIMLNALDPANARPLPCAPNTPFLS